jgi:DnaK suppressor protein
MTFRDLNHSDRREIQELLLDRSRMLEQDLAGLEGVTLGEGADLAGSSSSAPGHPAELASEVTAKSDLYGQLESRSGELWEVREALARLETGSFGICDDCGEAIPLERVRAIPYARQCIDCKSVEEGA